MFNNFNSITRFYYILIFIAVFLITVFSTPFLFSSTISPSTDTNLNINFENSSTFSKLISTSENICWPLPGYTRISSPFGYRNAPTAGATNFHGGIDLPAPAGTNIVSAISGKVVRTGFMGSGGCSVVVENDKYTVIFHHISPNYLVHPGEYVSQGQVIAKVGPKNVYGFSNNPYKDSKR